jgi:hypothetical protein
VSITTFATCRDTNNTRRDVSGSLMNLGKATNAPRADMTISDAHLTEFIFQTIFIFLLELQ